MRTKEAEAFVDGFTDFLKEHDIAPETFIKRASNSDNQQARQIASAMLETAQKRAGGQQKEANIRNLMGRGAKAFGRVSDDVAEAMGRQAQGRADPSVIRQALRDMQGVGHKGPQMADNVPAAAGQLGGQTATGTAEGLSTLQKALIGAGGAGLAGAGGYGAYQAMQPEPEPSYLEQAQQALGM